MNYKKLGGILGKIMILEGILMTAPLLVSLLYRESLRDKLAFIIPILALCLLGGVLQIPKPKRTSLYQKEGFALVAVVWIVMTLFGAIPFVISGAIPHYVDAFFETMSGFTTTGASIVPDVTALSHSALFWRSFTHWIGGMGILVFILIFIPEGDDGSSMHLLRAESPGPQVGKLVSKMKVTTRILYLIYLGMTVLEIIILMFDKPIPGYEGDKLFNSMLAAFGCAGTGGFGFLPGSIELFSPFSQYVMAIFLVLFGINFALYYMILMGKIRDVLKNEELRSYLIIFFVGVMLIFFSLIGRFGALPQAYTAEEAFRHAFFQTASIMTTTGYTTADFAVWPTLAVTVLFLLMFFGAMAGSTAGGIKTSRLVIAVKGSYIRIRKLINPRYVPKTKVEGKTVSEGVVSDVYTFITLYFFIFLATALLLGLDPACGTSTTVLSDAGEYTVRHGFFTNLSASLACISNIGPGFEAIGPYASYAGYSAFSKILLSLTMLIGRLEILPVFVLFSPKTWKKI